MSNVLKFPEIDGIDLLLDRLERELIGENSTTAAAFSLLILEEFFRDAEDNDPCHLVYQKLMEINSILANYTDVV